MPDRSVRFWGWGLLAFAAGFGLAAGCGLSEPVLMSEEPELRRLRSEVPDPKAWRVELEPVQVVPVEEKGGDRWNFRIDGDRLRQGVREALEEARPFAGVVPSGEGEADLSLRLKVTEAAASYVGGNENRLAWALTWFLLTPVAASFIADEEYAGTLRVEASLVDKKRGKPIWTETLEVAMSAGLDHWQRGISIWDMTAPGPVWADVDPGELSRTLLPHLERKFEILLASRLARVIPPPTVDVVVAVGSAAGGAKDYAERDARAVVEAIRKHQGRAQFVLFAGREATAELLLKELSLWATRRDMAVRGFVLYFSGCGTLVECGPGKAEAALLLAGPGRSPLPVSELLEKVRAIPAESRAVVLDAGFKGPGGRAADSPAASTLAIQPFPAKLEKAALLSACGPGETAAESDEYQGGVFTRLLLERWTPASDADKDGKVSCAEALEGVPWAVQREASFLGIQSKPAACGEGVLLRTDEK